MDKALSDSKFFTRSIINWKMGLRDDSQGFARALLWFLEEPSRWKRHYVERYNDWVEHDTLDHFITSRIPEGLETTPLWVYGQLLGLAPVIEDARTAHDLFLKQITTDVDSEYEKATKASIRSKGEIGGKGGQLGNQNASKNKNEPDNIRLVSDYGTSAEYTIRRLMKENQHELVDRVVNGELSANAAAIQAGFRKKTKSVPIDSAESAIRSLLTVFSSDELHQALKSHL